MTYKSAPFLIISTFVISLFANAQVEMATPREVNQFFNTQTLIVKHGRPFSFFNTYIENAAQKSWQITPYRIIEASAFNEKRQNSAYSFLIISDASISIRRQETIVEMLNIVLGKRGRDINDMPDLGSVPLVYKGDDEDKYLHKLPALLRFIQYQIQVIADNQISSPRELINDHNNFTHLVKTKQLWLTPEDLSDNIKTENSIRQIYGHDFKIVDRDKLEKAIENAEDILFVHTVAPYENNYRGRVWKFILSAKSGQVYYMDEHVAGGKHETGLKPSDFEALAQ